MPTHVTEVAKQLVEELHRGFKGCCFPEVRLSQHDAGEKYAALEALYYESTDNPFEFSPYFNHDQFLADFERHVLDKFPDCRVIFRYSAQEVEIIRNDYQQAPP